MTDRPLDERIMEVVARYGRPITASAITVSLGGVAGGVLGENPGPDVAVALQQLRASGALEVLPSCPVCGTVGEVWVRPGDIPSERSPVVGPDLRETADTLGPLIAEGEIEVGERVEVIEGECCVRASRPWRPTPPPA
ncbi:MAG: hypothetical protein U0Y82_00230 [Thermoleophilia bacterium]